MRGQPCRQKCTPGCRFALLEQRMGKRMRGICVFSAQRNRPFGRRSTNADVSCFGMRPAEIGQEPPILAIMPGVTLANREPRRVVVGASGKCVQAERAEQK